MSQAELYRRTILPSGVILVTESLPHVRSLAAGLWITTGSRHESRQQNGLSHLLEHMVFKGTRRRSAQEIAHYLESLGGHLDAFTSKEETCFYARTLDEHLPQALDILTDIVTQPKLSAEDLEKERQVILEEIKSVHDTPDDLVHDLLAQALFDGHPLSYPVLGSSANCRRFDAGTLRQFWSDHYRPQNFILAVAGNVDHDQVVDIWSRLLPEIRDTASTPPGPLAPRYTSGFRIKRKRTSQVHLCLGFPGLSSCHADRFVLLVLNAVLGGGMSSRLFQRIREQEGLAYSVYSYLDFYRDSGLLAVYLGVAGDNVGKSLELALKEIGRLRREALPPDVLQNAKAQLKGNLMLSLESVSNRMFRLARSEISRLPFLPLDKVVALIDQVSSEQIKNLAQELLAPERLALAATGQLPPDRIDIDRLRERLV